MHWVVLFYLLCFFFFQAEDGIRDDLVTGVQTCVFRSVIGLTVSPAGIQYTHPFEGQGPDCGMVILAQLTLAAIVGASPSGFLDGVSGELVKSLPQKLGGTTAEVDRLGAAAGLDDRTNIRG